MSSSACCCCSLLFVSVQPWLSENSRPGWPPRSTCFCLPSSGIKSMYHPCLACLLLLNSGHASVSSVFPSFSSKKLLLKVQGLFQSDSTVGIPSVSAITSGIKVSVCVPFPSFLVKTRFCCVAHAALEISILPSQQRKCWVWIIAMCCI